MFFSDKRLSIIVLISLSLFSILGCGGKLYRLYTGPPLPQNQVAVLFCPPRTHIKLFAVNDKKGPNDAGPLFPNKGEYGSGIGNSFHIELLPGRHTLTVGYHKPVMASKGSKTVFTAFRKQRYSMERCL